ncbi:MAG TPA: NADPH-dependent oxidoreductase [Sphingomonas sp.]|nr:NADPH-dependent oxidoreductase [Sphingomonas sp.]
MSWIAAGRTVIDQGERTLTHIMTARTETTQAEAARRAFRLGERYRDALDLPIAWNETLDTLLAHRSVRSFSPDPVPAGTIELLVAAAQSAASSSNLQPWSVVAIEDAELKARLAALAGDQEHIARAPLFLVWLIDLHRLESIGKARGTPTDGLHYLETLLLGAVDTAIAAQNAVVALESLGLGAVYAGGIRNKPVEVARELGLPPHVVALVGLAIGFPDPGAPASVKPRLPQRAVLFREQYRQGPDHAAIAAYDSRLRGFQRSQGMAERDWSEQATHRVRGAETLSGRHRMRDILLGLGFGLK